MSDRYRWFSFVLIAATLWGLCFPQPAQAQKAVIHALLLYSPTCPHCHKVLEEILPPLLEKYSGQLQILAVDVSRQEGRPLFDAAMTKFEIAPERQGVPALFIGAEVFFGSRQIGENLPRLIEAWLAQGGLDWPIIPGLPETLAQLPAGPADLSQPFALLESSPPANEQPLLETLSTRLARDPAGNALAILVLVGMLATLVWAAFQFRRIPGAPLAGLFPILCIFGAGVAAYLAYIEMAQVAAICGPVGDCNTVQQSAYARLFGLLPIGVLGLAGYIAMLLAWLVNRFARQNLADDALLALAGMTLAGTLFSIYLTFLEPFVIGATCAWCLASAITVTVLFGLSLAPAKLAWTRRKGRSTSARPHYKRR